MIFFKTLMTRIAFFLAAVLAATSCSSSREDVVGSGCENCHRPASSTLGIEEQHPLFALRCVECHGGDPAARSVAEAHVADPAPGKELRDRSLAELAATDPSYRRFINPGDPIVAPQTCGSQGPQGANGCHQSIVEASAVSVHATNAGLVSQPRFTTGLGIKSIVDADFQPANAPPGSIGQVEGVIMPALIPIPTASDAPALWDYAHTKGCTGCHLEVYGTKGQGRPNAAFAGGCSACHMFYEDDAQSKSNDPARNIASGVHPVQHLIEKTVPDRQCLRCHSRSLRIGQHWRGWRERTLLENEVSLANAGRIMSEMHGRPSGYFVEREDTRDPIDYTPPDIHLERGMACVDCHRAADGHGDGTMRENMSREVLVECEDCHGTFEAAADASGAFKPELKLRREGVKVILTGALDGKDHPVTQAIEVRPSFAQERAHSSANHGTLECYACHTSYMTNVYSLRRTLDYRNMVENPLDGRVEPGSVTDFDEIQVLGAIGNAGVDPNAFTGYHLGLNAEGKIAPFMVENVRLDVIVACNPANEPPGTCSTTPDQQIFGKKLLDGWIGRTPDGKFSFFWRPVFPHATATRATVQGCQQCHPRPFEPSPARVRATYGFGSGRFTTGGVDLTQMIDEQGNILVALPVPGSAPLSMETINRALGYEIEPPL